ncbi:hypothetical protein BDZ94DRAFT_1299385 [Collybia nuda]|uniref:Uncharacterized protein n=1 Tax=Collybia nuda TaxID=64659 RepID=A0A9P6CGG5_9AGAR|nr:hypothetical protein BDZ94DRAFT_1299385 [Collybia nuda]
MSTCIGILLIRLLAMYDNPRRLKVGLSLAFFVEIIVLSVMIVVGTYSLEVATYPVPSAVECLPKDVPTWFPAWWVPIILFDFMLFVFAVRIGLRHVRETQCLHRRGGGLNQVAGGVRWGKQKDRSSGGKERMGPPAFITKTERVSMVEVMLRDSILYYLVLLSINVLNALVWLGMNVFSISAVCIMGCRMILNLRHAFYQPGAGEASVKGANLDMEDMDVEGMLRDIEEIEEVNRLNSTLE